MDDGKMLVLDKAAEKRYTLGVVYEPDVTDTQGEFAKAEDIESAAWDFMARLQEFAKAGRVFVKHAIQGETTSLEIDEDLAKELDEEIAKSERDGLDDQHLQVDEDLGTIVESYIAPVDFVVNGQGVKKGAWLLGVVWSEAMFQKIKKGERTGLSMYGRAARMRG